MRRAFFFAFMLPFAHLGCASSSSGDAPQFTLTDVKPTIEGTWKGTFSKSGVQTPATLTLTYVAPVKTQCSNRTLKNDTPGETLEIKCLDVTNVNLSGMLSVQNASDVSVTGTLLIAEATYQKRGDVSLRDTGSSTVSGRLDGNKLTGSATLASGTYDFSLTR